MARIRKQASLQNLPIYDVLIEDSSPTSDYFRISQLPDVFSAGKNSFLIGASPYLLPRSAILVEIIDVNQNVIYTIPVSPTSEGDARIISVEIYENIVPGPYKLVIMGQANTTKEGLPTPAEWTGKYNVRWMKDIIVDPTRRNTSPIRFIIPPTIVLLEERRLFIPSVAYTPVTQSVDVQLLPRWASGLLKGYTVTPLDATVFNRQHINGVITGSFSYTNTITGAASASTVYLPLQRVLNSTTATSDGYQLSLDGKNVDTLELYNSAAYTSHEFDIVSSAFELRYSVISTEATL